MWEDGPPTTAFLRAVFTLQAEFRPRMNNCPNSALCRHTRSPDILECSNEKASGLFSGKHCTCSAAPVQGPLLAHLVLSPRQHPLQASGIIATFSTSVVCIPTLCEQKLLLLSGRLGKAHITDNILLWLREIKVDKNRVIRDNCRTSKPHSSEFLMSDSREGTGV